MNAPRYVKKHLKGKAAIGQAHAPANSRADFLIQRENRFIAMIVYGDLRVSGDGGFRKSHHKITEL